MDNFEDLPLEEKQALLGLSLLPGIGSQLAIRLLDWFGSAAAIFSSCCRSMQEVEGIGEALSSRILKGYDKENVGRVLRRVEQEGIAIWAMGTPAYPHSLYRLSSPPLLLYFKGNLSLPWREQQAVAIVGTRKPNPWGRQMARSLSEGLASEGYCIVSGGALGIDTTAHHSALAAGGGTLGVMATGVDCPYPAQNRELFKQMCIRGGGLLSEFPPGTRPEKGYFPRRNRLISALASGLVVVQCSAKSGALHSATCARRIQIPVMTLPGRPQEPLASGPHLLLRQGALLVESVADVIDVLKNPCHARPAQLSLLEEPQRGSGRIPKKSRRGHVSSPTFKVGEKPSQAHWPKLWSTLLGVLERQPPEGIDVDSLATEVEASVSEVSAALVLLELEGLVWSSAGMKFGKCHSLQK